MVAAWRSRQPRSCACSAGAPGGAWVSGEEGGGEGAAVSPSSCRCAEPGSRGCACGRPPGRDSPGPATSASGPPKSPRCAPPIAASAVAAPTLPRRGTRSKQRLTARLRLSQPGRSVAANRSRAAPDWWLASGDVTFPCETHSRTGLPRRNQMEAPRMMRTACRHPEHPTEQRPAPPSGSNRHCRGRPRRQILSGRLCVRCRVRR